MPVEIRELVIRAVVDRGQDAPVSDEGVSVSASPGGGSTGADFDALVQACVAQVLRILEHKRER
ncbi:conserved hypothetical protein [Rubrivivax sp. A210]|uniref:DUF5908 family protein n=1 Tax=Rubrivivax sp. A210 TaxID=2772301 RepID=UPI001919440C|nr:DUF5908 family protein [Rubrivivax sp. A210]CAD5372265.1 conserved hypothetical protein [Rubrivivax sp. A210]